MPPRDLITSIKSFRSTLLLTFMVVPLSLISIVLSREAAFGSSAELFITGNSSIISNLTTSCFSETGITLEGTGVQVSVLSLVTQR